MENKNLIYGLNDKPSLPVQFLLGLQHVFAAFGGIIVVPVIVSAALGFDAVTSSALISGSILASGLATIIQSKGFGRVGAKLPTVMGTDITFASPAIAVGAKFGLSGIIGATIVGGFIESVISLFTKPLIKFFPKVVSGVVVTLIGLSLMEVATDWFGGGSGAADYGSIKNISVAMLTMIVTLLLSYYGKGLVKTASIILGMIFGYLICIPLGMVDFSDVATSQLFAMPKLFQHGVTFHWEAIISFLPVFLVGAIGSVGRIKAMEEISGVEEDDRRVENAILADGVTSMMAGAIGGMANTTFAQNIGLLSITKTASRSVTIMAGIILTVLGLFPKFGTLIYAMPSAVLGGAGIIMFGMIAVSGIQMLTSVEFNNRNMLIIATSIGMGLAVTFRPALIESLPTFLQMIFSSGIITGTIIAITLNLILSEKENF